MREIICMEAVRKIYRSGAGAVRALDGVDLQIREGEYVAIMGPSGSGKSTMMNLLGCLDMPTEGRYLLDGSDVRALDDDRLSEIRNRKIGFVFQSFNLLPGQRQRVAVARALVTRPSIILADEPTGNLDTATSEEVMKLFDAIHRKGNTIILVTHEEDVARHACRIIRLRDGKIESDENLHQDR